jgi:hypothetical protein
MEETGPGRRDALRREESSAPCTCGATRSLPPAMSAVRTIPRRVHGVQKMLTRCWHCVVIGHTREPEAVHAGAHGQARLRPAQVGA